MTSLNLRGEQSRQARKSKKIENGCIEKVADTEDRDGDEATRYHGTRITLSRPGQGWGKKRGTVICLKLVE